MKLIALIKRWLFGNTYPPDSKCQGAWLITDCKDGLISEVKFFNWVLTPAEINDIMKKGGVK